MCFDDEVSVQDAFVVSACGHPICRSCAVRSVDFNIKQLLPQVRRVLYTFLSQPCIAIFCRNLCISSERPRHRHRRHFSECSQGFATPFYIQGAMKNCVVNSYFFARPIQEGVERKLLDVTSKSRYNLNFWNPHVKSLRLVYIWVQSEGRGG